MRNGRKARGCLHGRISDQSNQINQSALLTDREGAASATGRGCAKRICGIRQSPDAYGVARQACYQATAGSFPGVLGERYPSAWSGLPGRRQPGRPRHSRRRGAPSSCRRGCCPRQRRDRVARLRHDRKRGRILRSRRQRLRPRGDRPTTRHPWGSCRPVIRWATRPLLMSTMSTVLLPRSATARRRRS